MAKNPKLFNDLKSILAAHASKLKVVTDSADQYLLETKVLDSKGKAVFFAMVKEGKAKVSFHLMPVYTNPDLLDAMSEALRKRMHGKSCFNFTTHFDTLFNELSTLVDQCLERYIAENLA